jgi:hypothetical protein
VVAEHDKREAIAQLLKACQALEQNQSSVLHGGRTSANVFSMFNIGTDEVSHSAFLAWLFDPEATHGQGWRFLQAFLEAAQPQIALQPPDTYRVQTELSGMMSIIDIVVFKAEACILFVENKTTSPDTPGQHDREIQDLRRLGTTLNVPPECQFPVYLTPYGRHARGRYRRLWHRVAYRDLALTFARLLQEISDERARVLLEDWLETIAIFGGARRLTMNKLSKTSVLLGANWPAVLDIERARGQLDEELVALLFSLEATLVQQDWWQQGWTFRRLKREIYIWNTNWADAQGHTPLWMGVYSFNADRVFGRRTPPVFYFRTRKGYEALGEVLLEELRAEGHEVLEGKRHLLHRAILQCPHDQAAVEAYPAQVREQIVALFAEYADFAMRHEDVVRAHIKGEKNDNP